VQNLNETLFTSSAYATRDGLRTGSPWDKDHEYVRDLYKAYLNREPDPGGWNFWTNVTGSNGRAWVRAQFAGCDEFKLVLEGTSPSAPASGVAVARDGLRFLEFDSATNRITTTGFEYDAGGNQTQTVRADGSIQKFQYDAAIWSAGTSHRFRVWRLVATPLQRPV
jgi:hypothetical protein